MNNRRIPGVALAVVHRDRIIFHKAFGVSNVETGETLTPETRFQIASVTKVFTASAVTMLAQQGKLDLTTPVGKYLAGLDDKVATLNAHQLLSHTSGLKQGWPTGKFPDRASPLTDTVRLVTAASFFDDPGRVFSYSNPAFTIAGALIEVGSGRPYGTFLSEALLKPLKMHNTSFGVDSAEAGGLSQGHSPGSEPKVIRPYPGTPVWLQPAAGNDLDCV